MCCFRKMYVIFFLHFLKNTQMTIFFCIYSCTVYDKPKETPKSMINKCTPIINNTDFPDLMNSFP